MMTSNLPLIYAVVPAFNRCEKTLRFLREFAQVTYPNKKVVITDDGSTDNTAFNIRMNFPDVPVLQGNGDLWWSGGTNLAIEYALDQGADYILTINDDATMSPDFLDEMVKIARQNPRYIVGCRLHRQDKPEIIWSVGASLVMKRWDLFALNFSEKRWDDVKAGVPNPYPVTTMPGNGVLIPRKVFEDVGLYDATNMPQYHADSDLVLRAKDVGYQPVIALDAVLYNHIITVPLVNNRHDLIFSKKSDRYWKAVWATLRRHGPFGQRVYLLVMQYIIFFTPQWMVRLRAKWRASQPAVETARA